MAGRHGTAATVPGMTIEIQIALVDGVVHAGVARGGVVTDLTAERRDQAGLLGAVYAGRVLRIDRAAGAAFVDIGLGQPAYLPLRAGGADLAESGMATVQVAGMPREDKGAEVTLDIALAGRYLLRLPLGGDLAVSRALGSAARRHWRGLLGPGWVVRTAAAGVPEALVVEEAGRLEARSAEIRRRFAAARGPALLERGPGVARRAILDQPAAARVRLDAATTDPALAAWLRDQAPRPAPALEVGPNDIPDLLPELHEPVVPLPAGGSIIIEPTRALTAIDVNAGAARDPFVANREAAAAVARQVRLRNLGGIIVVDFISMARREEPLILAALQRGFDGDPARLRLSERFSPLGLVELARERRGPSLGELAGTP